MVPPQQLKSLPKDGELTPRQAIETVVENYGIAHSNAARLRLLQEWVKESRK